MPDPILSPPARPASLPDDAAARRHAGTAFEALVISQLLAAARPDGGREWRDMADRALAESLARNAPLSIADLLDRSARG